VTRKVSPAGARRKGRNHELALISYLEPCDDLDVFDVTASGQPGTDLWLRCERTRWGSPVGFSIEAKNSPRHNISAWMEQAVGDCKPGYLPCVAWKANGTTNVGHTIIIFDPRIFGAVNKVSPINLAVEHTPSVQSLQAIIGVGPPKAVVAKVKGADAPVVAVSLADLLWLVREPPR
jgi:hypothetical protein